MRKFGARYVYMEGVPGSAGGGTDGAPSGAPAASATTTPEQGAAAGAGATADPAGNSAGSALSGGGDWTLESVPEKYQVKGADGQVDVAATLRKVDEGRTALEKRLGEGGAAPKTSADYKVPEAIDLSTIGFDEASTQATKDWAHGLKLNQAQFEGVMAKYASVAPELAKGGVAYTAESAVASLKEAWKGDYDKNIQDSFRVVSRIGQTAGFTPEEVDAAIGNNPVAIRMFASLAAEMREDQTPASANGSIGSGDTADSYMAANYEAYSNPRDPKHKQVTDRVNALRSREIKPGAD